MFFITATSPTFCSFKVSYYLEIIILVENQQLFIKRCIAGDRTSQLKLYELYSPKMFLICQRYSRNKEDAEEILHDGFLKVFNYLFQFRNEGSLEGWIRKIMVNCALSKYRNKSHLHLVIELNEKHH